MKATDLGIVIHRAPYSETSLLVTLFTASGGLSNFLFQGGRKKHGNILYPLAHIEFTYYRRLDSQLGKISQVGFASIHQELPYDPIKASIAFFIVELVQQFAHHSHADIPLFELLVAESAALDETKQWANFPLWMCSAICDWAGIAPETTDEKPLFLDLVDGQLTPHHPDHARYIRAEWLQWMAASLRMNRADFLSLSIPKNERTACFDAWMEYIQLHISGTRNLKSIPIIKEVLS